MNGMQTADVRTKSGKVLVQVRMLAIAKGQWQNNRRKSRPKRLEEHETVVLIGGIVMSTDGNLRTCFLVVKRVGGCRCGVVDVQSNSMRGIL
jgi:hypothetical protein